MPMCGVPVHAADGYLARLIKAVTVWPFANRQKTQKLIRNAVAKARCSVMLCWC